MHHLVVLVWLLALASGLLESTGLQSVVSWDKYSLKINGERVFLFAGEFHYQRLPVPELWPDIFEKFKAHGLNAVRYVMGSHTPSSFSNGMPRPTFFSTLQHLLLLVIPQSLA
jgi:hypothetical protein